MKFYDMKNLLIDLNKSIKKALDQISKTGQKCLVVVAKNNKLLEPLQIYEDQF